MSDFLRPIVTALHQTFEPLEISFSNVQEFEAFLAHYGWSTAMVESDMPTINSVFEITNIILDGYQIIDELVNGIGNKNEAILNLLSLSVNLVEEARNLKNIETTGLPFPLNQNDFWNEIGERLVEDLIVIYLEKRQPLFFSWFHIFGIIQFQKEEPTGLGRVNYMRSNIDWSKLIDFFTDPGALFQQLYGWNLPDKDFDHQHLFKVLERILLANHISARRVPPRASLASPHLPPASIEQFGIKELEIPIIQGIAPSENAYWNIGLVLLPIPRPGSQVPKPEGLLFSPILQGSLEQDIPIASDIIFRISGAFEADHSITGSIFPNGIDFDADLSEVEIHAALSLIGNPSTPWILIGNLNSHRIQLGGFKAEFGIRGRLIDPEFFLGIGTGELAGENPPSLKVVLDFSESDGFIKETVSSEPIVFEFAGNLLWSSKSGVTFEGQAGFEFNQTMRLSLGPIQINNLYFAIKAGTLNGKNSLNSIVALSLKLELGPFVAVVEQIGLKMGLVPLTNNDKPGAFGNLDLDFGFKPPNGIGLSLDVTAVRGGGYLFFDFENERYGGALELSVIDLFSVTAIALITTRFPDGSKGFSLLLIISVEFTPGITLGMGFFLSGLGGMIGINRTIDVEAMRDGVKNNTIDHILFPENVVANITQIIEDLRAIFPPKRDQFVIGVMAKITYSTPTILSIELGVIIEFANPIRIAILGVLKAILPEEEEPVLTIQVNFLGIIDFEKGELSFDASLYNSKLLTFSLEGNMAIRLRWKKPEAFLLSVGGFHPSFEPPNNLSLRPMKRITLTISPDNPRIVLTNYFAITSNTVQFGADIDIYYFMSGFKVVGYLGYDVLFQFSPFRFMADARGNVEVKSGNNTLVSIQLVFSLTGPTPWIAIGTGSFKILFINFKVRISKTWGVKKEAVFPPIAVLPKVVEAFEQDKNWQEQLPARTAQLVSRKTLEEVEGNQNLFLQTFSSLRIRQNIAPLNIELTKFGNFRPSDVRKIRVHELVIGNDSFPFDYIKETFAPASFKNMADKDKLKAPSYQEENSGIVVTGTDKRKTNYAINREVRYEVRSSDHDPNTGISSYLIEPLVYFNQANQAHFALNQANFVMMAENGAVGRSELGRQATAQQFRLEEVAVQLQEEKYAIVNNENLTRLEGDFVSGSQAEATDVLNYFIGNNPEMKGQLSIVPEYELEEAF